MHLHEVLTFAVLIGMLHVQCSAGLLCRCECCANSQCTSSLSTTNYEVWNCSSCAILCRTEFTSLCMKPGVHVSAKCSQDDAPQRASAIPNWIGVFTVRSICDKGTCCCVTGDIRLASDQADTLNIQGQFNGDCQTQQTSFEKLVPMPNSFSFRLNIWNQWHVMTLSQDSREIKIHYADNPACREIADRRSAVASYSTNGFLIIILLSVLATIRQ